MRGVLDIKSLRRRRHQHQLRQRSPGWQSSSAEVLSYAMFEGGAGKNVRSYRNARHVRNDPQQALKSSPR
jgi:hypothetical protein